MKISDLVTRRSQEKLLPILDWLPLAVATTLSVVSTANAPAWQRMWLMTLSLYGGFKFLTWRQAVRRMTPHAPSVMRSLAYLFLWPGMDAVGFLAGAQPEPRPPASEWLRGVRNVFAGMAFIWVVAARFIAWRAWAGGWTGLVGIGLFLHFGVLHLLSLAWRRVGVHAAPIMQRPTAAASLTDFWGRRWNTAFRDLAHQLVYRPLVRSCGARQAMAAVFLFSGILHDLAISIPARAGYGLPTLYFILQAIGVEVERSSFGRRWKLRGGVRGWTYAAVMVLFPACLLFHPPFLRSVVIPFLHVLRA